MIPVQEITVRSNDNWRFEAFIEKHPDNIFNWWL